MTSLSDFKTIGLNPRFPTRKEFIKFANELAEWDSADFFEYINRQDNNNIYNIPDDYFFDAGYRESVKAYALALKGVEHHIWLNQLSIAVRHQILGSKIVYFWHENVKNVFPNKTVKLRLASWEIITVIMGTCYFLSMDSEAEYIGYLLHAVLNSGYQLAISYNEKHRRGLAFMARLFARANNFKGHIWPDYAYDEVIYEGILERWDVDDVDELRPWIVAACDRHTYQAVEDTRNTYFDFQYIPNIPLEILMLYRIREIIGLHNPVISHPLLSAPFDKIWKVDDKSETDYLELSALKRIREDWPNFDQLISLNRIQKIAEA